MLLVKEEKIRDGTSGGGAAAETAGNTVVGLILGDPLNPSLHQSLMTGHGSWLIFLKSPISGVILALALF